MTLNLGNDMRKSNVYLNEIDIVKNDVNILNVNVTNVTNEIDSIKDDVIDIINELGDVSATLTKHEEQIEAIDDITKRPPEMHKNFNSSHRYWKHNEDIWVAAEKDAVNRRTSWIKDITNDNPIIDNISNVRGCYWTKKIVPTYTGKCINVSINNASAGVDIGFQPNGELDVLALNTYLRTNIGTINIWYDQSGNANDLTAAGLERPIIRRIKDIGGTYGILFEYAFLPASNPSGYTHKFLTIPNSLTLNSNSFTISTLIQTLNSNNNFAIAFLQGAPGSTSSSALGYISGASRTNLTVFTNNVFTNFDNVQPAISDEFISYSSSSTRIKITINDTVRVSERTPLAAVALAGGRIGGDIAQGGFAGGNNHVSGGVVMAGIIISSVGQTREQLEGVYRGLISSHEVYPQIKNNLIFDGDSITQGTFNGPSSQFYNLPNVVSTTLINKFKVYNFGDDSGTFATQRTRASPWWPDIVNPDSDWNIIVVSLGVNDIGQINTAPNNTPPNNTAQATYDSMLLYINGAMAAGYDVILGTILPAGSFNTDAIREGHRLAYNEMIKTNIDTLGILGVIDYASDFRMGDPLNTVAGSIYYSDGVHPTPYGYQLLGAYASAEIKRILKL